jgi:hypothetical protein
MAINASARRRNRNVYTSLIVLAIVACMIAGSTIGFIAHEYVTRVELREPPEQIGTEHSWLPTATL